MLCVGAARGARHGHPARTLSQDDRQAHFHAQGLCVRVSVCVCARTNTLPINTNKKNPYS